MADTDGRGGVVYRSRHEEDASSIVAVNALPSQSLPTARFATPARRGICDSELTVSDERWRRKIGASQEHCTLKHLSICDWQQVRRLCLRVHCQTCLVTTVACHCTSRSDKFLGPKTWRMLQGRVLCGHAIFQPPERVISLTRWETQKLQGSFSSILFLSQLIDCV